MIFRNYIEIKSNHRFGKPIIKGTRISVYDVLNWLANGMTISEILEDFPELNKDSVMACLHYAAERESHLGKAS